MRPRTPYVALRSTAMVLGVLGSLSLVRSSAMAQTAGSTVTGSTASFRGLSVATDGTIWVSGTGGTVLRSTDGGAHWEARSIADARSFDLRDVEAVSATTAYAMVAGDDTARIYKTTDGGQHWVRQYDDTRRGIFLDGFAFWDEAHGIALGDPMAGRFVVLRTEDGGAHWTQVAAQDAPPAQEGEAAFAASGTAIAVGAGGRAWIGTSGNQRTGVAHVMRSTDYGRTWQVSDTPILGRTSGSGIFSLAFYDSLRGVAVGGDYQNPEAARPNVALTVDGGKTWQLGDSTGATGYLSGVTYLPGSQSKELVAVGTAGTFGSRDSGHTWQRLNADPYNAVTTRKKTLVAAGEDGQVTLWPSVNAARNKSTPALQRRPNNN